MNREMKRELTGAVAWAGATLALALAASIAHRLGHIDRDTVMRVVGINGLWMAWYGNRIPKTVVPNPRAFQAQRVAAWSMVLSGLAYAGLWTFAPIPLAVWVGSGVVVAGIAVTFGYCLSLRGRAKAV